MTRRTLGVGSKVWNHLDCALVTALRVKGDSRLSCSRARVYRDRFDLRLTRQYCHSPLYSRNCVHRCPGLWVESTKCWQTRFIVGQKYGSKLQAYPNTLPNPELLRLANYTELPAAFNRSSILPSRSEAMARSNATTKALRFFAASLSPAIFFVSS